MNKKADWNSIQAILAQHGIKKLYHFTDRDNLESIIRHGGLYSWHGCAQRGITIPKPGGADLSRQLDLRDGLEDYVRLSFTPHHPMMYAAMQEGRISNPVILEIDPEAIGWEGTLYSDRNATRNGAQCGSSLADFEKIHFNAVMAKKHFDLDEEEQPFFQAEVMVKDFLPLQYITNIDTFGIPVGQQLQARQPYTAQITRKTPTAFIFLVDQSVSMQRETLFGGTHMTLAEAVAQIVNNQIQELVYRCIKSNEVRHYFDIAVVGYGERVVSGWQGTLAGRDFVSPEELQNNPFKRIIVKEETRTRKGVTTKEVERVHWVEPVCNQSWTRLHLAFDHVKALLEEWLMDHAGQECYPPTVIHITDGEFNGTSRDALVQQANEIKSMFTPDGNVLLWNIHIIPTHDQVKAFLPTSKAEVYNSYSALLYDLSSLLPTRYNADIAKLKQTDGTTRHVAMAENTDLTTMVQLMDIGTPTNINQNV